MVFYIHGIASMVAASYVDLSEEAISSFLTDGFEALKKQYQGSPLLRYPSASQEIF